jgi:hypothetical protein
VGVAISSGSYGGFIGVTRDGNTPVEINRKTSDGTLITFRKDSSSVGSIGASVGDLTIYSSASGHCGLRFTSGGVAPIDNTGSLVANSVDIGQSSWKFRDLYLSGTAYSLVFMGETSGNDVFHARNTTNGNRNYRGLSDAGAQTFYVTEDGAGYFAGGTSSDATLKNVVEDTPHGLDKLKQIDPKTYYWKNRGVDEDGNEVANDENLDDRKHYGVLAQELETVLPEITYGTEGNMSVDYNGILMVAVNSIKELSDKIETLESEIATLKGE